MDYDNLIERLRKEAYGSDIEDLLLGASTAIETLWADLARVTAERNAAQALLAEISGVIGSAPITTAFGIPLERIWELVEADRLKGKEVWAQAKYLRTFPVNPDFIESATILYISLLKDGDILCHTQGRAFSIDEIGKTAFLAREEAEAALKAREALDDGNE